MSNALAATVLGGAPAVAGAPLPAVAQPPTVGLFVEAMGRAVPAEQALVWTSGYRSAGKGAACYRHDPAVDRAHVRAHPHIAFIAADGRGFRLADRLISVFQTGAEGDGRADDTAACQAALDAADANGGGHVTVPPGDYRLTAALVLPGRVDLSGWGQTSILRPVRCDGIMVAASSVIGPRRVAGLWLSGEGCEQFTALVCDLPVPQRAQGLVFENLYISFFGTGVRSRGLWHSTFRTLTMNNVRNGIVLVGQNIKILVEDGRLVRGNLLGGTGPSVGIAVGDGGADHRPEDVQIVRTLIYGFAKGVVWRTALFGSVTGCDLDACGETGLELVTADGGFSFRDNWVQLNGSGAGFGVNATALGYTPQPGRVLIADNRFGADGTKRGCGIFLGNRQANVTLTGNSVAGAWAQGLRIEGARRILCSGNRIGASVTISRSASVSWSDNMVDGPVVLTENRDLIAGHTFGPDEG